MTQIPMVRAPFTQVNPFPFSPIPHELLSDRRLKPIDIVLIGHLLRYARGKASCWPCVATLSKDIARCERSVQYALARLQAAGWIGYRPDGNPTGRLIILNWRQGATPCPRRVQPYSQGIPGLSFKSAAPEAEKEEKKTFAPLPIQSRTHAEVEELFSGWMDLPEGHPLRAMAMRRVAASATT